MKNGFKKLMALVISVVMLISMLPTAFAEGDYGFVDFPTGWSHAAMAAAVDNGLLRGFEGNEIRPRVTLTRAELATIITRAFGAKTKADISNFTDVSKDAWYYDSIAMAVQMGILNGMTETTMAPDNSITRQEVFTAVARALVMSSDDLSALDKFSDSDLISDYAKGHMAYLAQKGYINGDDLGNVNPKKRITREEFAQFMYNLIKTYITEPGTYTGDMEGIVVVRVGNVTIKNARINEDLVIGDGAGTDDVKLQGVTIDGRFLVRGGTITVSNTTIANGLVVNNPNGVTVFNNFRSAFKSIIENTKAQFKTAGGGGGGGGTHPSTSPSTSPSVSPSTSPSVSPSPSPSVSPSPSPSVSPSPSPSAGPTVAAKAFFYDGYSTDQYDLIAEVSAAQDGTVALPAIEDSSYKKGYEKDSTTASVYTNSYVHRIAPSYWYLNASNMLVPFTASTVIESDTNVFLLAKTMSLMLTLNNSDAFLVKTPYNDETRVMDSAKGLAFSGKSQLKLAVDTNIVSDEIPDAAIEKLAKTGVIDTDRNIQIIRIKLPISTFVKENTANNVVKQYIRDVIGDEAQLDAVLDMVDIQQLVGQMDISAIINSMDNQQLADLIRNAQYKNDIVDFILSDIGTANSTMLPLITNYIVNDVDFREKIIDQLVDELGDTTKSSALKTAALDHIKTLLGADTTNSIQQKFITMLIDSLEKTGEDETKTFVINEIKQNGTIRGKIADELVNDLANGTADNNVLSYIQSSDEVLDMIEDDLVSTNSIVMPQVVVHAKSTLGDATNGKDLRKTILMSTDLTKFLNDPMMKNQIINMLVDATFVDKVLANNAYRSSLLDTVVSDEHFIDEMIKTQLFVEYVVDNIHHGDLKTDIEGLLNSNSSFKAKIVASVKQNNTFCNLLKDTNSVPYKDALNAVLFSDFVPNETDFLKFVFNQSRNAADIALYSYDFVDATEVESVFEDVYADMYAEKPSEMEATYGASSYSGLTAAMKQTFKNDVYALDGADDVKPDVLDEMKKQFDDYKKDIINKLANKETVTDATVNNKIEALLIDYVERYILEDATLDPTARGTIETILVDHVKELVKHPPVSGDEEEQLSAHIEALKTRMLNDSAKVAEINAIIKEYINDYPDSAKTLISNNYSALAEKLVTMIQANGSTIYNDVDAKFAATVANISDSVISDCVKNMISAQNGTFESMVKDFLGGLTTTELANYIKSFLTTQANKDTVKGKMLTYIQTMDNETLAGHLRTYVTNNRAEVENLLISSVKALGENDIAKYVATFMSTPANKELVKNELNNFLQDEAQKVEIEKLAKTYLTDSNNRDEVKVEIENFIATIDAAFVASHRADILSALNAIDLSTMVDKAMIKEYISGLTAAEKTTFADKIYNALKNSADYKALMDGLMHKDNIAITSSNASILKALSKAIKNLTLDKVLEQANNATVTRLVDLFGKDTFAGIFNRIKNDYCDGLDAAIDANQTSYTTDLTLAFDPINEVYKPLYDKAQPNVIEKLQNADVRYNANQYLQYLANHDILANLLDGDASLANGDDTGYTLRSIQGYYEYLYMLLVVGDDALCWYGDDNNVTDAELDAVYEAIAGKMTRVHNKVDNILAEFAADGTVPAKVQTALDKVKQLNDLFLNFEGRARDLINKYLNSDIYDGIESGGIGSSSKGKKVADLLFGQEEPVVTLDTVYTVFYNYDDNMQEALRKVVQNGKLEAAVEKFEASAFGSLLQLDAVPGDLDAKRAEILANGTVTTDFTSVYDFLVIVSEYGIAPFATDKNDVTVIDAYEATIGKIAFKVKRHFQ